MGFCEKGMRMRKAIRTRSSLWWMLSATLAMLPLNSQAFTVNLIPITVNGVAQSINNIGWQSSTVVFDFDTSCNNFAASVTGAVTSAMDLWNHVPSANLKVTLGGATTLPNPITSYVGSSATLAAPSGNPVIYCDTNFQTDSGAPANSIPGFASSFNADPSSGKMMGALLVLNVQTGAAANIATLSSGLVADILAHEIGHVLGLGHSADPNALMYFSTSASHLLALAQDDVDGITFLYPRQEPGSGKFFGCASVGLVGTQSGPSRRSGRSDAAAAEFAGFLLVCAWMVRRARVTALISSKNLPSPWPQ